MSALPPGEPPDGGWGWLVALAGFLANSLTYGILRCLGILFEDLMEAFDASAAQVSWVTAIALATEQFASECWGGNQEGFARTGLRNLD